MNDNKIRISAFILPVLVWIAGLVLVVVFAPKTVYVNGMVAAGFLLMCAGTLWMFVSLYREYDRTGKKCPAFLEIFFPDHPVVDDFNELTRKLSGFRRSYSDYLSGGREEKNSSLQNYATQLMWHSAALQKKRLMKNDLTLEMESVRRAYSGAGSCVRQNRYFDGRYKVNDVYEEIEALRTVKLGGKIIKRIRDNEVAHFTLLSADQAGANEVTCPNCGSRTTRENLLDGCDYCGTRFTVEDMKNRVDSFGLRHDFRTNTSKKEAVRELMLPWTTLIMILPLVYFGIVGAFVYAPGENIFIRLVAGIVAAGLLGLLGWALRAIFLTLLMPLLLLITSLSESLNRKMIYSRKQEEEQERMMADQVRKNDQYFSLQSFFGGLQNKLSAIHFADSPAEINAFFENDMSVFLERYKNVADIDFLNMTMDSYEADEYLQKAAVSAELRLMELHGKKIRSRNERLKLTMIKDANCKTQAVCGPAVLKCRGCGAGISLMEGKTCSYCGRSLDLKLYDWVVSGYEII
ncbi:MAG: zinc ribbon domain-containing protein [Lachnospiraceae bacterium]|nr:zinc ribbon domain-containing protein [Lachnospiraceae bacterium]